MYAWTFLVAFRPYKNLLRRKVEDELSRRKCSPWLCQESLGLLPRGQAQSLEPTDVMAMLTGGFASIPPVSSEFYIQFYQMEKHKVINSLSISGTLISLRGFRAESNLRGEPKKQIRQWQLVSKSTLLRNRSQGFEWCPLEPISNMCCFTSDHSTPERPRLKFNKTQIHFSLI